MTKQRKCWAGGRILSAVAAFGATMIVGFGLQAQTTLYWGGGTSDISDGTPLPTTPAGGLTGDWNDSVKNWSNAYSPTVYQAWSGGAFANLGYSTDSSNDAAITVSGNKTLSGMFATLTAASATNRRFAFNGSSSGTTLTLTGDYATFLIDSSDSTRRIEFNSSNTNLSFGSSSTTLIKDGNGSLQLGSSGGAAFNGNALTGNVLIRNGSVNLASSSSSLNGVQTFDIIGYRPSINYADANGNQGFTMPTLPVVLPNSSSNRLNDNAVITLKRGIFTLSSGGGTNANETIGSIILESAGIIHNSNATANGKLNVGSLSRGSTGFGTAIMVVDNSDVAKFNISITNPGTIPTDVLLPWFSTSRAEWVMIDSSNNNQITRIAATPAATDVSTWNTTYGGTDNLRVNAALTGTLNANLAINSLGFLNGTTLDLGTYTLTLNSGALGFSGVTPTIQNGNLTTNSVPLYINGGWTNSGGLNLNAKLTGNMDIYYTGQTTLTIGGTAGANDYTGTMYIQSGTVNANKAGAINGNVVVNTGAGLQIVNVSGIASGANVTIQKDGLLRVNSSTANLTGVLTINDGVVSMGTQSLRVSGGLAFNGGVINSPVTGTTVRQLELMSDVSYASSSGTQAVIQWNPDGEYTTAGFNVQLSPTGGAATRTFTIADSTNHDKAEMLIDVPIINGSGTGNIVKEGNGVLQLTGANTYTGTTTVNAGTLHLARIQAAAQSGLTGTFTNSGVNGHILTFVNPITSTMAVGQTVSGNNIAPNRVIAKILNDYQVILSGNVGSTGNTYATNIALGAVNRAGSLTSAVTINSGGTLLLDEGTTVNNTVTVNNGGALQGKGTVTGGVSINGTLTPGTSSSPGTLNLSSTLTFGAGSVLYFRLGTVSDKISFATASDNLVGSGNVTLSLILGNGFSYANTYTIFENTTTEGFTFAAIVGYDTANYIAVFQKSGNNYVLSFTENPTANSKKWDFNGDSRSDFLANDSATSEGSIYLMNGLTIDNSGIVYKMTDTNWQVLGFKDFDGDGDSDILWQHATSKKVVMYIMNGLTVTSASTIYKGTTGWLVDRLADFNGDGKCDILWKHPTSGGAVIWLMNGTNMTAASSLANSIYLNWVTLGTGDFNGDGKADILWEKTSGSPRKGVIYLMNGTAILSTGVTYSKSDINWTVTNLLDYDGDGKCDILWKNPVTNSGAIYLMNGTSIKPGGSGIIYSNQPVKWQVIQSGDFNADGKNDLLWHNDTDGQARIWLMNGLAVDDQGTPYTYTGNWVVKQLLDFNDDDKADILMQNTDTKQAVGYLMNGTAIQSGPGTLLNAGTKSVVVPLIQD